MIKKIPKDLINKIAAGEVVERPASVVKELVENAIDAKAKEIIIHLEKGGSTYIKVSDNGSGISAADLPMALEQHATSKISTAEDLFNIRSMGFRGEALASISAVSQFTIISRADEEHGYKLSPQESSECIPAAMANRGTSIEVKNIFYSVPARQKFLKSPTTELRHIVRYLNQAALVNSGIAFSLTHNNKSIFTYQRESETERIQSVLGLQFFESTIKISSTSPGIKVEGRIATPTFIHATHANQYLFVNGRPVVDYLLARKVADAYETLLPKGYHPAFVIFLNIHPGEVDVNVHPRKWEVKFKNPNAVFGAIFRAVKESLRTENNTKNRSNILTNENMLNSNTGVINQRYNKVSYRSGKQVQLSSPTISRESTTAKEPMKTFQQQEFTSGIEERSNPLRERGWKVIAQLMNQFMLAETAEGIAILDQHAVSEIINYHQLIKQAATKKIQQQQLLVPEELEVNKEEKILIQEHQRILKQAGWDLTEFSGTSLLLQSIPSVLVNENIAEVFQSLLTQLKEGRNTDSTTLEKQLILFAACRSAIKFGDHLDHREMEALLGQWLITPNNQACEHGRPSIHHLATKEMLKWFKR